MTDSQQPQTTSCGSRGNRSRSGLTTPPPAAHVSYNPEIMGKRYGWVKIISPEKRWSRNWNHCLVRTVCLGCGSIQWQYLDNLRRGISKGCQSCSQPRQIPSWLDRRLTAAKQRCENPNDPNYPRYGARGIRFEFPSVTEAGLYLISKFGIPSRELELDRIDNDGNYAPGNIRFVTRQENVGNRQITILSRYDPKYWPYAETTVRRKLKEGLTREEIIRHAKTAVAERRKNWMGIAERLESMTYEMPADITVLPYRGNSSTTADMEAETAP